MGKTTTPSTQPGLAIQVRHAGQVQFEGWVFAGLTHLPAAALAPAQIERLRQHEQLQVVNIEVADPF
jgi:hypothetical protein